MKQFFKSAIKILLIFVILTVNFQTAYSSNYDELQAQINTKKELLEQLEAEEAKYNEELSKTQATKGTLSTELKKIKANLDNLNFKIKVTNTQIETLTLEIDKLGLETRNTEQEIDFKKEIMAKNIRNLYEQDHSGTLIAMFLKNDSLSDTMLDVENMINFGKGIEEALLELQMLKEDLKNQKIETEAKKKSMQAAQVNLSSQKKIVSVVQNEKTDLLNQTKSQEKNYQNLLSEIEKNRMDIEAEMSRLEEALKAEIDPNLLPKGEKGILQQPVKGIISQGYGITAASKYFYSKGNYKTIAHNGVDFAASVGTTVYAAEDGEVIAVGNQDKYCYRRGFGKFIVIKHNNNLTTLYAHLSLQLVKVGDTIKRGEAIGYVGNTGFSTGPHLHFSVYFGPTFRMSSISTCGLTPIGGTVNPMSYI